LKAAHLNREKWCAWRRCRPTQIDPGTSRDASVALGAARGYFAGCGAEGTASTGQIDVRLFKRGIEKQQVRDVEKLVNEKSRRTHRFRGRRFRIQKPKQSNIQQFFGEKYGDTSAFANRW
jgi:hypothetical protein